MKLKRIIILLLSLLLASGLNAQHKRKDEKSLICIRNIKTNFLRNIYENSKVKYWLTNSEKAEKGRIEEIKDSSIVIKGKEIKLKGIRKIGVRKLGTIPLATLMIIISPFGLFIPSIVAVAIIGKERNLDLINKWKFAGVYKPVIDSSRIKKIIKEEKLQNESSSTVSFSINALNYIVGQYTMEAAYQKKNYSIGLGGGIVKSIGGFGTGKMGNLQPIDDNYPTGVYNGWLMSLNFKRLNITRNHWYCEASLFYKYLYYDHIHFSDHYSDTDLSQEWIRSEVTNVYGIKLLMGKRILTTKHFFIETILGVSLRERQRSYLTYWTNIMGVGPWGLYHRNQFFPGLQAGLLLTIGNFNLK